MISYGNLSDAQLLQIYGFVEEHEGYTNPWNSVSIPANAVDLVIPSNCSLTTAEGLTCLCDAACVEQMLLEL